VTAEDVELTKAIKARKDGIMHTDEDTAHLADVLCGYLVGALHGLMLDVEWHHDGTNLISSFTVTNHATGAAVVIHVDPAVAR
jgi:hypothetical protein